MRRSLLGLILLCAAAHPAAAQLRPLPLVEVPATSQARGYLVAVLLSADGGWVTFDRVVAGRLADAGVPVVGWSSLDYYRQARTPAEAAGDLATVLRTHLPPGARAYIIGYSFGADVLPFLVNRLPPDLRARVAGVAVVGPSSFAVFQFHASEWVGLLRGTRYATLPELRHLGDLPVLCIYGKNDRDAVCKTLMMPNVRVAEVDGGHRMAGISATVGELIVRAANEAASAGGSGEQTRAVARTHAAPAGVTPPRGGL
jgi:type IV secretory pathway VirJ component